MFVEVSKCTNSDMLCPITICLETACGGKLQVGGATSSCLIPLILAQSLKRGAFFCFA